MAGGLGVAVAFGCGVVKSVVSMFSFLGVVEYCGVVDQGFEDDEMNSDESDSEMTLHVSSS